MKYHEMTNNYIFRELECGLTIDATSKLCFKSVKTVKDWDKGKQIPPECKRLMRMSKLRELSFSTDWEGFYMVGDKLHLPSGEAVSAQQVLLGIALASVSSELELKTSRKVLKIARSISRIKS
ncbi:phage protein [Vibrio nigripulchritudo]|uniref:phage protein n=1 Tax=Vibrio nigripulchritudo TaxID=28173 RepID=UPI0005F9D111|nr:phage protein [Vibrio nigripulchritudo]KJY76359.1 regulator [Vibrio nigripulchritudo]